jgi:hypothetical protein
VFVPLFWALGHRLEIRSQFGKGVLNVNVAGRVCELQTFFGLLQTSFDVSMTAPNALSFVRLFARRDRRSSMKTIAASLSRPGATTRFSTIRMTKDRADDASPAVRDAMLAAIPGLRAFAISLSGKVDRADDLVQPQIGFYRIQRKT